MFSWTLAAWTLAAAIVGVRPALGDTEHRKPALSGLVEVRFVNGSVVVMSLEQDKIEIQTDYGALTVPSKEVLQIDFGVRVSADERRRVDEAIKSLASPSFPEREQGLKDLVSLGPVSFRVLQNPSFIKDLEAKSRAQTAVAQIRERFHPRLLRLREDDVLRTAKFTIVGRITTPTIKANAEEFGQLELRPAKLLVIRALANESNREVVVDAATYGNQGRQKWLDTGIRVEPLLGLKVGASGQIDLWPQQPGQYMAGPEGQNVGGGMPNMGRGMRGPGNSGGELIGRIGETGSPFFIGSLHSQTPKEAGKLYLQIAPSPWGNPSTGEYKVTVTIGPFGDDSD